MKSFEHPNRIYSAFCSVHVDVISHLSLTHFFARSTMNIHISNSNLKVRFLRSLIDCKNLNTTPKPVNFHIHVWIVCVAVFCKVIVSHINVQSHDMNHTRKCKQKLNCLSYGDSCWLEWAESWEKKWIVFMRTVNVRVRLFNSLVSNNKRTTTPTIWRTLELSMKPFPAHNAIVPPSIERIECNGCVWVGLAVWLPTVQLQYQNPNMSDKITTRWFRDERLLPDYDVTICYLVHVFMEFHQDADRCRTVTSKWCVHVAVCAPARMTKPLCVSYIIIYLFECNKLNVRS